MIAFVVELIAKKRKCENVSRFYITSSSIIKKTMSHLFI